MLLILLLIVLYLVLSDRPRVTRPPMIEEPPTIDQPRQPLIIDNNIGMLGYKTRNFGISHGMSKKMFESMKQDGMSHEDLKEFLKMEDYLLGIEIDSVCRGIERAFDATSVSFKIKEKFKKYDFSYHTKHIKQTAEPNKTINRSITCEDSHES